MRVLQLIIKQKFFDEIIAGTKKQELREIKPTTYKKYLEVDESGFIVLKDGAFLPIHYDAIRFYVGYNPDRDTAIVEVTDNETYAFKDENHELITYDYKGMEFLAAEIVYNLDKVLEKK